VALEAPALSRQRAAPAPPGGVDQEFRRAEPERAMRPQNASNAVETRHRETVLGLRIGPS
jgi:hypothetical protein